MALIHATCLDIDGGGILLTGDSGSGKSDLALRLIEEGAKLVADDQVELVVKDGVIYGAAPQKLAGLIEVRGLGVLQTPNIDTTPVQLVLDLVPHKDVERMPEITFTELCGVRLRFVQLYPFEVSATLKVRHALKVAVGNSVLKNDSGCL